jgi:hypothetical protein
MKINNKINNNKMEFKNNKINNNNKYKFKLKDKINK